MRKLLVLAFLITGVMNAQNYNQKWSCKDKQYYPFVTAGFDVRNLAIGSKPTNNQSELDYHVKLGARANIVEVSMFYENFKRIDFQAYGINVNGVFELYGDIELAFGIEAGSVIREGNSNFLMAGTNSELRVNTKKFIFGLQLNNRYRRDLIIYGKQEFPIVNSVFFNVTYKLK